MPPKKNKPRGKTQTETQPVITSGSPDLLPTQPPAQSPQPSAVAASEQAASKARGYFLTQYNEGFQQDRLLTPDANRASDLAQTAQWGLGIEVENLAILLAQEANSEVHRGSYLAELLPSGLSVEHTVGSTFHRLGRIEARLRSVALRALDIRDDPSGAQLQRVRTEYLEAASALEPRTFEPLLLMKEVEKLVREGVGSDPGSSEPGSPTSRSLELWAQAADHVELFLNMQQDLQAVRARLLGMISYPEARERSRALVERGDMAEAIREALRYMDLIIGQAAPAVAADFVNLFPNTSPGAAGSGTTTKKGPTRGGRSPSLTSPVPTESSSTVEPEFYDYYDYRRQALRILSAKMNHLRTQMESLYNNYLDVASERITALPRPEDRTEAQRNEIIALTSLPRWYQLPAGASGGGSQRLSDPFIRIVGSTLSRLWTQFVGHTSTMNQWGVDIPSLNDIVRKTGILIPRDDRGEEPNTAGIPKEHLAEVEGAYRVARELSGMWHAELDSRTALVNTWAQQLIATINGADREPREAAAFLNHRNVVTERGGADAAIARMRGWLELSRQIEEHHRNTDLKFLEGFREAITKPPRGVVDKLPELVESDKKDWAITDPVDSIDFEQAKRISVWFVRSDDEVITVGRWFPLAMQAWIIRTAQSLVATMQRNRYTAFSGYPVVRYLYSQAIRALVRTQFVATSEELLSDLRAKTEARSRSMAESWSKVPDLAGAASLALSNVWAIASVNIVARGLDVPIDREYPAESPAEGRTAFDHYRILLDESRNIAPTPPAQYETEAHWRDILILDALVTALRNAGPRGYPKALEVYSSLSDPGSLDSSSFWRDHAELRDHFFNTLKTDLDPLFRSGDAGDDPRTLEDLLLNLRAMVERRVEVVGIRIRSYAASLKLRTAELAKSTAGYLDRFSSAASTARQLERTLKDARKSLAYGTPENRYVSMVVSFETYTRLMGQYATVDETNGQLLASLQKRAEAVMDSRRTEAEKRLADASSIYEALSDHLGTLLGSIGLEAAAKNTEALAGSLETEATNYSSTGLINLKADLNRVILSPPPVRPDHDAVTRVRTVYEDLSRFAEGVTMCSPDAEDPLVTSPLCETVSNRLRQARALSSDSRQALIRTGIQVSSSFQSSSSSSSSGPRTGSVGQEMAVVDRYFVHLASTHEEAFRRALADVSRVFDQAKAHIESTYRTLERRAKKMVDDIEAARRRYTGPDTPSKSFPSAGAPRPSAGDYLAAARALERANESAQILSNELIDVLEKFAAARTRREAKLRRSHAENIALADEQHRIVAAALGLVTDVESALTLTPVPLNARSSLISAWSTFSDWLDSTANDVESSVIIQLHSERSSLERRAAELISGASKLSATLVETQGVVDAIVSLEILDLSDRTFADRARMRADLSSKLETVGVPARIDAELERFRLSHATSTLRADMEAHAQLVSSRFEDLKKRLEVERRTVSDALAASRKILDSAPVPLPPMDLNARDAARVEERRGTRGMVAELYRQLALKIRRVQREYQTATVSRVPKLTTSLGDYVGSVRVKAKELDAEVAGELERSKVKLRELIRLEERARTVINRVLPGFHVPTAEEALRKTGEKLRKYGGSSAVALEEISGGSGGGGGGGGGRDFSREARQRRELGKTLVVRTSQLPKWLDVFSETLGRQNVMRSIQTNFDPEAYGSLLLMTAMRSGVPGLFCGNIFITRDHILDAMDTAFMPGAPSPRSESSRLAACYLYYILAGQEPPTRFPDTASVKSAETWRTEIREMNLSARPGDPPRLLSAELRARAAAYNTAQAATGRSPSDRNRSLALDRLERVARTLPPVAGQAGPGVIPTEESADLVDPYSFFVPVWGNVFQEDPTGRVTAYREQDPDGTSEPVRNTLVLEARSDGARNPYSRFVLKHMGDTQLPVGTILGIFTGRVIPTDPKNHSKAQAAAEQAALTTLLNTGNSQAHKFGVTFDEIDRALDARNFGNELRFIAYSTSEPRPGKENTAMFYVRDPRDSSKNAALVIATHVISRGDVLVMIDSD